MTIPDLRLIDADDCLISPAEQEFHAGLNAMRVRRQSIYRDWRPAMVPNVTLEQGAWLLLGEDPLGVTPAAPEFRELRELRFRELLNRLECAVAEHELRPFGKPVEGFAPRFHLAKIAAAAVRINIAMDYAQEILAVLEQKPDVALHHEIADLRKRAEVHRQFVASSGETFRQAASKSNSSSRRKTHVEPLDFESGLSRSDYNEGWRAFCARNHPEINLLRVSDAMLDQDRSDLNIRLRAGRKPSRSRA